MKMQVSNIFAILLLICTIQSISFAQRNNVSEILDNILRGYDARIRPHFAGSPVDVGVTAYILDVSSVSEANMDFTIDLYFRQTWTDERLTFSPNAGLETITLDPTSGQKIWEPDTFFSNERHASLHHITKPNKFTRISANGKIVSSVRLSITASCPMKFKYFPMDSHVCTLEMESYGMTTSEIVYNWLGEQAVGVNPEVSLANFKVIGHKANSPIIQLSKASYSRLSLDFQFVRSWGHYVVNVYIPAIFLVILSWTAFMIRSSIVRMVIGVMTSLTLLSLMGSTNAALPFVSCMKAIDVYLVVCLLMTFASLAINIAVEYLAHAQHGLPSYRHSTVEMGEKEKNPLGISLIAEAETESRLSYCKTDKISIFALPIVFLIFNFFYFIIYASVSDVTIDGLIQLHK